MTIKKIINYVIIISVINACSFGRYNKAKDFKPSNANTLIQQDKGIIIFKPIVFKSYNKGAFSKNWQEGLELRFGQILWKEEQTKKIIYSSPIDGTDMRAGNIIMFPVFIISLLTFGITPIVWLGKSYKKLDFEHYIALEIPTGKYSLKDIISTKHEEYKVNSEYFELKAGDIIYLGDLTVLMYKQTFKDAIFCINAINRINEVETFLHKYYPNLTNHEVKTYLIDSKNEFCNNREVINNV